METAGISIRNISKQFPKEKKPALHEITAEISPGKIVGLIGPDGSGKTTLIRILTGLLLPADGQVRLLGLNPFTEQEKVHAILSYMPQKFGLYEDLTVLENINLYAALQGVESESTDKILEETLRFTRLAPFTKRLARNLSGGMQQKLGIVCALLKNPKILILDEPTVGIDPLTRRELWGMMQDLVKKGVTIIWSTSYLDEAERCDEVLLLNEGRLLYFGLPGALTKKMEGKTFVVDQIAAKKSDVLQEAICNPHIIDSVFKGDKVRFILKDINRPITPEELKAGKGTIIRPTPPQFEDAFVDILGGGPKHISPLAEKMPEIKENHHDVIVTKDLTKAFGSFIATNHLSFSVKRGEIFGLLGPNGAGKSTTFRLLCGLIKPTSGTSFVNGVSLEVAPGKARGHIGYMAQKFSLYGNMTVYQNLRFFSGIYPLQERKQQAVIDEIVSIFTLEPYLDIPAATLPLGFKQRLALSCAVMHRPQVLFLDEATSGVDPVTRREFWNHIHGLVNKGSTVMITTHFMDEAEYCDRIGFIFNGKLLRLDSPDAIKKSIRCEAILEPTLEDAFVALCQGEK